MFVIEFWGCKIRVGIGEGLVGIHLYTLQGACIDQPAHHRIADFGQSGEFANCALPSLDSSQAFLALRREAVGDFTGGTIFDHRLRPGQRGRGGQDHPQHRGQRREIIIRGPFGEAAQRGGDRRNIDQPGERAKAVVADFLGLEAIRLPSHADQLARTQGRDNDAAGFDRHAIRHPVVERPERGIQGDNTDAGEGHIGCPWGPGHGSAIALRNTDG